MAPVKSINITANDQIVISVYKNICYEFTKYRNLSLENPIMEDSTFSEEVFNKGHVVIKCNFTSIKENNGKNKNTYIILYHFIMSDQLKAADIKKMINKLKSQEGDNSFDIIFITQNSVSTHLGNYIKEYLISSNSDREKISCMFEHDETYCNCHKNNIYTYTYYNFIITVPKHILVPDYKVLSKEESNEVIRQLYTKKSMLPKIKRNDPCVIWSSGNIGDIIQFTRNDEVTGKSIYYRVIV